MGGSSEEGVVEYLHARWDHGMLGNHGQKSGPAPPGGFRSSRWPDPDHPGMCDGAGQNAQQRGLTSAVGADDRSPGPGGHLQIYAVDNRPTSQVYGDP